MLNGQKKQCISRLNRMYEHAIQYLQSDQMCTIQYGLLKHLGIKKMYL